MKGYVNDGEYKLTNKAYVEEWNGDTWYPVLKELNEAITALEPGYQISQIKAKFGGLRYYTYMPQDADEENRVLINNLIRKAEEECERIDFDTSVNRRY